MHTRCYTAFISYRHADNTQEGRRWAEWLHRGLERYVVPPDLIGQPNLRGDPIRDSLYPIFRDEDELPANADLATGIRAALEVSDHLIVLCSPRSAISPWVRKEVCEFKELGRSDRILAIILAGEPNADDPAKAREGILRDEECFCEELRFGAVRDDGTLDWTIRTEPLAADLRPLGTRAEGFVTAEAYREYLTLNSGLTSDNIATRTEAYRQQLDQGLLKVIAGLLGVPLGQLIDRDAAHRTELAKRELERAEAEAARLRGFNRQLAIAGVLALMFAVVASWFWWRAGQERRHAEMVQKAAEGARDAAEELITEAVHGLREKLFGLGRLDVAEDIVKAADDYYQRLPPDLNTVESERHRASLVLNHAMIATALGKDEEHELFAKAALQIADRLAKEHPERGDLQKEASYAMLNLCELEHDRANYDSALSLATQVVSRCEAWRKRDPLAVWTFYYEVLAHDLAGQVLVRRQGNLAEGAVLIAKATSASQKLREVAGETAETCEAEGLIHYSEGKIAQKLRQLDQAVAAYEAAAVSFTRSIELGGDSALLRELQAKAIHHAGSGLYEVALKHDDSVKRKRGEDMVRRAYDLRSKLVALEPGREEWWRDLGWSHDMLAQIAYAAKDNEATLLHRRGCVRCRNEAINRHPGRALLFEERASSLGALSDALARQQPSMSNEAADLILQSLEDWQHCLEMSTFQLTNHGIKGDIERLGRLATEDRQEGVKWLAKARAIVEPLVPKLGGHGDARVSLIKLLMAQQDNYAAIGRQQEANEARATMENSVASFAASEPDKLEWRERIAEVLEERAVTARNVRDWALAEEFYKKELAVWKEIAAFKQARPGHFASWIAAHQRLAQLLWDHSRRDESLAIARDGMKVAEPWLEKLKELQHSASGVGAFLHTFASMLSDQKQFEEAALVFPKAIQVRRFLVETFPNSIGYLNDLASTDEALLNQHIRTGDKAAGEQALRAAITLREKALKAEPKHPEWQDKLASDQLRLGDLRKDAKDREEALALYEQALQTWTTLVAVQPGNPDVIGRQCNARDQIARMLLDARSTDGLVRARQLLEEGTKALRLLETRGQLNDERRNWLANIIRDLARL